MSNDLSVMLEVPENTDKKELVELLRPYGFSLGEDAVPFNREGKSTTIYTVTGPKNSYENLRDEVENKGYQLWSNPKLDTFGPPIK